MSLINTEYTAFVVEDDKFYSQLLKSYLTEKENFQVFCFSSGEECIRNISKNPDLILLDYFLDKENPDAMNGKSVYKQIRQLSPDSNIIVVSAQQSTEVVFSLFREGMKNYVEKGKQTFSELDQLLVDYA